ncbi:exported hypothetical protein [metagenome]|uniref:Uncharacterized protein n=1 Tax=metagenome TaxID=256318 RepID=A0A2P2C134_9ZZZZ
MTFRRGLLLTLVLSGVTAALVMVFWQVFTQPMARDASASTSTDATSAADRPQETPALDTPELDTPELDTPALDVLREWDRRRARVWARGDVAALARLYLPGSAAGERDRRLLAAYAARGLRVEDMHTQVLSAEVRIDLRDRLVIDVTDRLSSGAAVGHAGRTALPRDRATRHTVTLVRHRGRWVVREVS